MKNSEENNFSLLRRNTINLNNSGYRPASVVTQKRKTVEIFLDKINKSPKQKYEMKFNNFERKSNNFVKNTYKDFNFYEGDPYNKDNNKSFIKENYNEMRDNLIDSVYLKTELND